MRELERMVLLNITDNKWREHLYEMDYLEEGIHLRAYGQKDPLTEYRREAFEMFQELTQGIREEFVRYIYRVELVRQDEPSRPRPQRVVTSHGDDEANTGAAPQAKSDKVGRNAPCPCGSGRKYKKCHGATT
jgi:preprotein translocase subunit SecA